MNRSILLAVLVPLTLLRPALAGGWCGKGVHCIQPGPTCGKDCSCPCANWRVGPLLPADSRKLIAQLGDGDCCDRIAAAKKLGNRLCFDFCDDPAVLPALARAVLCDTCWQVRKAAVCSLCRQKARSDYGMLVLYLASRLDSHYLVRDAASEAIGVLSVGRQHCYRDLFRAADQLIPRLRPLYRPTQGDCIQLQLEEFCAAEGLRVEVVSGSGGGQESE
jgi:hypothetical protein